MDIAAHALWAGAGALLLVRQRALPRVAGFVLVALAVVPDLIHALPVAAWALFNGLPGDFMIYLRALPDRAQPLPTGVELWSHHLHCIFHSGVIALGVTAANGLWLRAFWWPLAGWWSHILIDVFTHSDDFYPSPVFYPFTYWGFDGIAWNRPSFVIANYAALAVVWAWLLTNRKKPVGVD